MQLRFGRWFELDVYFGEVFLKAPLVGEIYVGPGGCHWDR